MIRARSLLCFAVLVFGCRSTNVAKVVPSGVPVTTQCDIRVSPADVPQLRDILDRAPDGATVCFEPGRYRHYFFPKKSVTLRGLGPGVVFRGDGSPNITVARPITVVVENVTMTFGDGGANGGGGNVDVSHPDAKVTIRSSTLTRGESMANGGGAVGALAGEVTLERCLVTDSRGRNADAILSSQSAHVIISNSVIRGVAGTTPLLRAVGYGRITARRSSLLAGAQTPVLELDGSDFLGYGSATIEGSIVVGQYRILDEKNRLELHDSVVTMMPSSSARAERLVVAPSVAIDDHGRTPTHPELGPSEGRIGVETL